MFTKITLKNEKEEKSGKPLPHSIAVRLRIRADAGASFAVKSGKPDSNRRPLRPERSALPTALNPDCGAKISKFPKHWHENNMILFFMGSIPLFRNSDNENFPIPIVYTFKKNTKTNIFFFSSKNFIRFENFRTKKFSLPIFRNFALDNFFLVFGE